MSATERTLVCDHSASDETMIGNYFRHNTLVGSDVKIWVAAPLRVAVQR
jgi:hypothetical protein